MQLIVATRVFQGDKISLINLWYSGKAVRLLWPPPCMRMSVICVRARLRPLRSRGIFRFFVKWKCFIIGPPFYPPRIDS